MTKPFQIKTVHLFIATDKDGVEGVIGMETDIGWLPFVAADPERLEALRPMAKAISRAAHTPVTLAEFSIRTDKEVIK